MKKISLGIDTSCYTTSLVVMDEDQILFEKKKMLEVKKGTVGLRQSDAFFQHVKNLPTLYAECCETIDISSVTSVTVSNQPRNVEGSYMPVFLAGEQMANMISQSLQVPLYKISHQENHVYAVDYLFRLPNDFYAVHLSGGTSEILKIKKDERYKIDIIGSTLDMSVGKLIDRLGVYMGFDFPCGKALDHLQSNEIYPMKLSIKDQSFNISGIENKLKAFYDKDQNPEKIANTLFNYISDLLIKVLEPLEGLLVMSGGVTANTTIRHRLNDHFQDRIVFTDINYATDHAVGNAYYGLIK